MEYLKTNEFQLEQVDQVQHHWNTSQLNKLSAETKTKQNKVSKNHSRTQKKGVF